MVLSRCAATVNESEPFIAGDETLTNVITLLLRTRDAAEVKRYASARASSSHSVIKLPHLLPVLRRNQHPLDQRVKPQPLYDPVEWNEIGQPAPRVQVQQEAHLFRYEQSLYLT